MLGGIAFSERILYGGGIDWANQFIAVNTPWGRDVLTFNTFSDRLKGWAMLTKASTYSAFGNLFKKADEIRIISYKDTDYRHDILTSIVINTGVVGLGVFLAIVVTVLVKAHGPLLAIKNSATRWEASVALACAFTVSALSVTTGNVFSTTPINFQIWTAVGTFLVLSQSAREEAQEEETREPTSAPWRQARLPARNAPRLA